MKLVLSSGGVPPGSYLAKFIGTEPSDGGQYGPGIKWSFEIVSGRYAGQKICRTTGLLPTLKNGCGKMLIGVSGKAIEGEEIDLAQFIGRTYLIVLVQRPEGGTSLDSVTAPPVG